MGRWSSLEAALRDVWSRRAVCDDRPWAIGWLGYAACADLAGGLPAVRENGTELDGLLLLEPERTKASWLPADGAPAGHVALAAAPEAAGYAARVEAIREAIAAGSVYQVNLCRRFSVRPWAGGLRKLFLAAREGGGEDYLCAMAWDGERAGELVCASMETLLRQRGARLETLPIKGTRRRGATVEEDRDLVRELAGDPKERAELAMIVDLERNDLGRVARTGSVVVEDPGSVGTWAVVHHRMARVAAQARDGVAWWEILAAVAPGGSVTGCPKRAAMRFVTELEERSRGPFTGALGLVTGAGDMEFSLPIRTAWTEGASLEMAAGCGIVWESDPVEEERESRLKISRWLDLVEDFKR